MQCLLVVHNLSHVTPGVIHGYSSIDESMAWEGSFVSQAKSSWFSPRLKR